MSGLSFGCCIIEIIADDQLLVYAFRLADGDLCFAICCCMTTVTNAYFSSDGR